MENNMNQDSYETNKQLLQELMQQAGITDIDELSRLANVARLQLIRIQRGLIHNISVGAIARIAGVLDVSLDRFVATFSDRYSYEPQPSLNNELAACRQEYQQLQQAMNDQQATLAAKFQQESLEIIESWLLQWPTATAAVQQNPQLPATRLLSLVEPVEQLLKEWNVETIAAVGEEIPYDPQYHELMKGSAQPGELVKVRYVGYQQQDKLLYKAKVSPVWLFDY